MTVFNKSVSWSKFKLALDCPLSLQGVLDKRARPPVSPGVLNLKGKLVQKVFELYFNNQLNLKEEGRRIVVLERILDKVLNSKWATEEGMDTNYELLKEKALPEVHKGYELFDQMALLRRPIKSEQHLRVSYNGFRMYGVVDFMLLEDDRVGLYDGKGNYAEDADERQILYYAVAMGAGFKFPTEAGFLYWQRGWRPVDISPPKMKEWLEGDFRRGRKIFEVLKTGTEDFPANPSKENCQYCSWRKTCPSSAYLKSPQDVCNEIGEVGFT